ncbi:efflux RND transporter periplasmic adaptor subunit [Photobacterium sp. TY1-4]|uniref:efflux RND transporter periplasmic adaptor subunit n=1 Tax=Photobacterium sp. TY1-4 TaxID=2899122 RepID=UPI0021C0597D|nr:efflux RND transporter periplasmic adaptor subunit [Photobacterium sp. TY1-4]UXI00155.1 efflux RND transporter periplasmic adaptor subunit [Photobacterium sp. TY1-4]
MTPKSLSLIALLIVPVLSGCNDVESAIQPEPPIRPVKLMTIEDMKLEQQRIFPAKIAASRQADLAFRIGGELVKLELVEGQQVNKSELLAQLDDRDAKNALLNAEANHELALVDFTRKQELYNRKLISKAEFDTAKATLKSAQAALNTARDQLAYTRLEAPFSGIVAKINLDNYQNVQPTQVVLTLQGNEKIDVSIQVPESLLMSLKNISFDEAFKPRVRFSAPQTLALEKGFTPTLTSSRQSSTYPVQFKERASKVSPGSQTYEVVFSLIPPENLNILPGMSAELLLDMSALSQHQQAIAILPMTAIVRTDNSTDTKVWRYDHTTNQIEAVSVHLGKIRGNGIEVVSGLQTGDQIVAVGATALKDNMEVKPLRWERGV